MANTPGKENPRPPTQRRWRRLNRNLGLRLLAIGIAVGLWIFVNAGQRSVIDDMQVPIDYRRLPPGFVIVNHPPQFVAIQVTGPRTLLSLLDPERLVVRLDLSGVGQGQASFKINPSMFSVPRQTAVTSIAPSDVVLDVDRVIQRGVPVHLDLEGQPSTGYRVSAVQVSPSTVLAIGPSRYVNPLQQISTEPFDIQGISSSVTGRVDLVDPNPAIALTITRVDAKADISEKIADREFHNLNVAVHDSDYKFHIDPPRVNVTIRGPLLKLNNLNASDIVFVDAKELEPGFYEIPLQVNLPDGMQVVREFPDKVKLRIYREKRSTTG